MALSYQAAMQIAQNPAVWKRRPHLMYLETFIHLGDKGALTEVESLQINCYHGHTDDLHQRESTFANPTDFLRLVVGKSFDEMEFVLRSIRLDNLKRLSLTAFKARDDERFGQIFSGLKFPNLVYLNCYTTVFLCHALIFASACPNLEMLYIYETQKHDLADTFEKTLTLDETDPAAATFEKTLTLDETDPAAATFENLTHLMYEGYGTDVAKHFVRSTKLLNLDVRFCETQHWDWTTLMCKGLEELLLPIQAKNDVVEALLTKWHETLKTVSIPASFAWFGLLQFLDRFKPQLEDITVYSGVDEEMSSQLREQLLEACPSLKNLVFE